MRCRRCVCALPRLALRTCTVQRPLSARLAWQIRRWSCALVEEQGTSPSRVSYRLAHTSRCLAALIAVCGRCSYHHSARQYYHYGARRHGQWCRCCLRLVDRCQQRHVDLERCRRLFPASDPIATAGALFRSRNHLQGRSSLGGWELQVSPATAPNQTAYAACTPALVRRLCPVQVS